MKRGALSRWRWVWLFFSVAALSARAETTLYAFQATAPAAIAALNARPDHEIYVLASAPLPTRYAIPRFRKPLNVSNYPKGAPVLRTSVALVVDKTGTVVDTVAFNFNDARFADTVAAAMPRLIAWVPNQTRKKERALIILTFNTGAEDPEEFQVKQKP